MTEQNKKNLKRGVVVFALFIGALLAIASNVAVWNAVSEGASSLGKSEVVFSVLNLLAEGGLLWFFGKKALPKAEE